MGLAAGPEDPVPGPELTGVAAAVASQQRTTRYNILRFESIDIFIYLTAGTVTFPQTLKK